MLAIAATGSAGRTALGRLLMALMVAATIGAPSELEAQDAAAESFYAVSPAELSGRPGTLIRAEQWEARL